MKAHGALAIVATAALAVSLTAATSVAASPTNKRPLSIKAKAIKNVNAYCKKAKNEPELLWYSSNAPAYNIAALEAFNKVYPSIKATVLRLSTGDLTTRYDSEIKAGAPTAGLVTAADPVFMKTHITDGVFRKFKRTRLPSTLGIRAKFFHGGYVLTGISLYVIAYNTNLVKTPPKSWNDLAQAQYQGKILHVDPRSSLSQTALVQLWQKAYGDKFLTALKNQRMGLANSTVPAAQQLAAGQYAIGLPSTPSSVQLLIDQGAPIKYVVPALTTGNEAYTAISANTKSPNTALCLYNFIESPRGQQAINANVAASPLGQIGNTPPLPKNYSGPAILSDAVKARLYTQLGLG
jgi:iron(III) transport system substrate-binding protein